MHRVVVDEPYKFVPLNTKSKRPGYLTDDQQAKAAKVFKFMDTDASFTIHVKVC